MARLNKHLYLIFQVALLVAAVAVAAMSSRSQDWQPYPLLAVLLVLTAVGQFLIITIRNQQLTAAFIALVLAMSLLGPAPAALIATAVVVASSAKRRLPWALLLNNVVTYMTFPVCGGLIVRGLVGNIHRPQHAHALKGVQFALVVFVVFIVTNALNFALIAIHNRATERRALIQQVRELFIPFLPGQIAAAAMAAVFAVAYTNLGFYVLLASVLVIVIFQYLAVALLRSEERADQLEARSIRLASLQLGVLVTLVETLASRDRTAARHAAAVARLARLLAVEVQCSEADQDIAHSAGLLHDIGKFALPDRILHAESPSPADRDVVRRHPQAGATLVGRLDGYGPVSDVILYHHEHMDGTGYPAGLIGNEIPLLSRILAVCNAYDRLTARDSHRVPMSFSEAIEELARIGGRQLDADLVRRFVQMLQREGTLVTASGDDADFEVELAFERRARAIALTASAP